MPHTVGRILMTVLRAVCLPRQARVMAARWMECIESGRLFSARTNWKLRMPPISPQIQHAENRIICGPETEKRFMLMQRAQLISYQQNSKQADSVWWDGRYTQRYWAPISISRLFFGRRLLWWVMRISQNKSDFLLENWIALKANCLFQKYCTLVNMLASLTGCISACVCVCVCVADFTLSI